MGSPPSAGRGQGVPIHRKGSGRTQTNESSTRAMSCQACAVVSRGAPSVYRPPDRTRWNELPSWDANVLNVVKVQFHASDIDLCASDIDSCACMYTLHAVHRVNALQMLLPPAEPGTCCMRHTKLSAIISRTYDMTSYSWDHISHLCHDQIR